MPRLAARVLGTGCALLALGVLTYVFRHEIAAWFGGALRPHSGEAFAEIEPGLLTSDLLAEDVVTLARGLDTPQTVAFLPDGEILIAERAGTLRSLSPDGSLKEAAVEGVASEGESGLLGMAAHPDFLSNRWLYLFSSYRTREGLRNRVDRYRFEGGRLQERTTIVQSIPAADTRNGGALAFGPDGLLYAATGDADTAALAQDPTSLAGKILRLKDQGTPEIWALGFLDPKGLAWDGRGHLWATDRGKSHHDELNLIEQNANYGWGADQETEVDVQESYVRVMKDGAWDPGGAAARRDRVFFAAAIGESLYELVPGKDRPRLLRHFEGEFGPLRGVAFGPDGFLYLLTARRDGDDRLIRISPRLLD